MSVPPAASAGSQILSPTTWTEATYNEKINTQLVAHPEIGPAPASGGVNWKRLEGKFFAQLRADRPNDFDQNINSLPELLDRWFKREQTGVESIKQIADYLATACRHLLSSVELDLRDFLDGCVIDLLWLKQEPQERAVKLDKFIRTSVPYLPMNSRIQAALLNNHQPSFSNLLGAKAGDIKEESELNLASLMSEVTGVAQHAGANLTAFTTLDAEKTSLLLCREAWGIPLQFYDSLESLHEAYMERGPKIDECHIDCNRTWKDLPDICAINPTIYELLRENVENVLFAMIVGTIRCEGKENSYIVRVPDIVSGGMHREVLGSRVTRIVKKVCEDEGIRKFLEKDRRRWESDATPKQLALVYASALTTWEYIKENFEQGSSAPPSPLGNCTAALMKRFQLKMSQTPDGLKWFNFVRIPAEGDEAARAQWETLYDELLSKKQILYRASAHVPIYEVRWDKAVQFDMPPKPEQPAG